ncbi:MAG: hypothetical protein DRZ82_05030 [Thermoprotei archaeon]|nr:MAG: hypothetical protein DRZ82_05030 [Thermoprotei archaeon]
MRVVRAFSPAGLSGFFATNIVEGDLLHTGAIGGGITLEKGVYVTVKAEPSEKNSIVTLLDGKVADMYVAKRVAEQILELTEECFSLVIDQKIEVPIGGGLGTSGASAIATALAVAKALNVPITYYRAAQIAHVAEILSGTGLGTVSGLVVGGLVLVVKPGAPGYDKVERIIVDSNLDVIICFFSPVAKERVLKGKDINRINEIGKRVLNKILEDPTPETFMSCCLEFARNSNLISKRVLKCVNLALKLGAIGASQTMIGDAVFALADRDLSEEIIDAFRKMGGIVLASRISWAPARLI